MRPIGTAVLTATLVLSACSREEPAPAEASARAQTPAAMAAWTLDPGASRIGFVSIKAGEVIEAHHFSDLSGSVSPEGEAVVTIPLDRVETKVDIRNERMREMFFETAEYPVATISTDVAPQDFAHLSVGEREEVGIDAVLSLHGQDAAVWAEAYVTRIADDRIEVAAMEPVVLSLADFDLEAGLEALREVAGLPSITPSSAVTFTFVFDAEEG